MTEANSSFEIPTLLTIRQFADKHKFISEAGIRTLIFKQEPTISQFIVRIYIRIYLDEKKFFSYLMNKKKN